MASRFLRSGALALLALGLLALIPACGEDDVPAPTTPPPAPPPAPEPPGAPAGFQVSASGEDFIEWSWTAVEGADAYDVQLSLDAEFDGSDPVAAVTATSFRNPLPLPPETTAHARVRSAAGEGGDRLTSGWSDPVSGMTTPPALTRPETPAGLRVSAYGEDFIEWSWSEVPGAHGYQVEHSRNEQFMNSTTADVDADTRSYRVEDLPSDTSVYLHVRSFVGTGDARLWSEWSVHRTGMTEAPAAMAPATPTIADVDTGEDYIEWSWNAVSGAEGYEVQFSLDGQFSGATTVDRTADQLSYRKEDLDPETPGHLRVRAFVVDDGERLHSMWSEAATAVTEPSALVQPAAPQNVRVKETGPTFIEWSWNPVPEVAGYEVRYSDNAQLTGDDPTEKLSAEVVSYRKTGLDPETEHYLQVRAYVSDGDRTLASAWTPTTGRSGKTDPAKPAAPMNLRFVTATTDHDSIGWAWDPVPDADRYEYQFSLTETFADNEPDGSTSETEIEIDNRDSRTDGYLRVRSVVGTGSSARRSDWSDTSRGMTTGPPAAVLLSAPTGVSARPTTNDNNSITVTWNEVASASSYEVQQRAGADVSWNPANCGGANEDNEVIVTSCVASGLDAGTDHDFQVRALPASADRDRFRASAWSSTAEARTTGRATTTTPGGMGNLNVKWEEDAERNEIRFYWERRAGATYETALPGSDLIDEENPCTSQDLDWSDEGSGTSRRTSASQPAPSTVIGLCVRVKGSSEQPSFAWGITRPEEPNPPTDISGVEKGVTTEITWTDLDIEAGFTYEIRLAADPQRDDRIKTASVPSATATPDGTDPMDSIVQSACDGGVEIDDFESDIDLSNRQVSVSKTKGKLEPYTGYLLCVRARNDLGASAWSVPVSGDGDGADRTYSADGTVAEVYTRPAAPPKLTSLTAKSIPLVAETSNEQLAPRWEIGTRSATGVPRHASSFTYTLLVSDNGAAAPIGVENPKTLAVMDCSESEGETTHGDYSVVVLPGAVGNDDISTIRVEIPDDNAIERYFNARKVYLCVQANSADSASLGGSAVGAGVGPWTISSSSVFTVSKPRTPVSHSNITSSGAEITVSNWGRAVGGYSTTSNGTACAGSVGGLNLAAKTKYTVRVWARAPDSDNKCASLLGSTTFTTEATQ